MFSLVRNGARLAVFAPGTEPRAGSRHPIAKFSDGLQRRPTTDATARLTPFHAAHTARAKVVAGQRPFLDRLLEHLAGGQ